MPTLEAFISTMKPKPQKLALYYFGEQFPAIHHARTRLECSKLNAYLCLKLHVALNPVCKCGYEMEVQCITTSTAPYTSMKELK